MKLGALSCLVCDVVWGLQKVGGGGGGGRGPGEEGERGGQGLGGARRVRGARRWSSMSARMAS